MTILFLFSHYLPSFPYKTHRHFIDIIHISMTFSGIEQIFFFFVIFMGRKIQAKFSLYPPRSCTTYIISIKETQHNFCQTSILYT